MIATAMSTLNIKIPRKRGGRLQVHFAFFAWSMLLPAVHFLRWSNYSGIPVAAAVCPPDDVEVRHVADKLAEFVAKNGRSFEEVTRQKNPGDTPFR